MSMEIQYPRLMHLERTVCNICLENIQCKCASTFHLFLVQHKFYVFRGVPYAPIEYWHPKKTGKKQFNCQPSDNYYLLVLITADSVLYITTVSCGVVQQILSSNFHLVCFYFFCFLVYTYVNVGVRARLGVLI